MALGETAIEIASLAGPLVGVWVGSRIASRYQQEAALTTRRANRYERWLNFLDEGPERMYRTAFSRFWAPSEKSWH